MSYSPDIELRRQALKVLKEYNFELPLPGFDVRSAWDVSGDLRGTTGIVVNSVDNGGYNGNPPDIFRNCQLQVKIYTHLQDDEDGELFDRLQTGVQEALTQSALDELDGWEISHVFPWASPAVSMNDAYREKAIAADIWLQKK